MMALSSVYKSKAVRTEAAERKLRHFFNHIAACILVIVWRASHMTD